MAGYTSVTPDDLAHMLATIGSRSIEELFDAIPEGVRLGRPIDLPPGEPEQAVYAELRRLAARNVSAEDEITFLGAGMSSGRPSRTPSGTSANSASIESAPIAASIARRSSSVAEV